MTKGRMEAFSDAVLAIIITIMVLELHAPDGTTVEALGSLAPKFLAYILSFVLLATYWNNHHHMCHAVERVSGAVLWANMHLLFWLSLVPFATAWLGDSWTSSGPVALYGVVTLMAAVAYFLLVLSLVKVHGPDSQFAVAIDRDIKGKTSVVVYAAAVVMAFIYPPASLVGYVAMPIVWLVPDRRFEFVPAE